MKKISAVIEARMTSTRLPGKHMMLANGKPIISYLINRLKKVPSLDHIIMATTSNDTDNPLVELASKMNIDYFRGSEANVMLRVIESAESVSSETVVSITGDCPLIDPIIIEQAIQTFIQNECDYVNNAYIPGYPGGMNVQVYSLDSLKRSYNMTTEPLDLEHVTSHILRNPKIFKHIYMIAPMDLSWPEISFELDEQNDYDFLKKIIEHFDTEEIFSCKQVIDLLQENPDWVRINNKVSRKGFE
jgi:spore coat polysaccharide biosynthesis protein SpsF